MTQRTIHIEAYDPAWVGRFTRLGRDLRDALADVALRIDHIGSTAVPGLAAKPVVDIQISVAALEPVDPFRVPLEELGSAASPSSSRCCSGTTCACIPPRSRRTKN